jgi:hypothetical protein
MEEESTMKTKVSHLLPVLEPRRGLGVVALVKTVRKYIMGEELVKQHISCTLWRTPELHGGALCVGSNVPNVSTFMG